MLGGLFATECSTAVDVTCQERLDEWDVNVSTKVHGWAAFAAQILLLGTPFAFARALWDTPVGAPALAVGVVGLGITAGGIIVFGIDNAPDGLTQRLSLASLHAWAVIVAAGVLWATRAAGDD